MLASDFTPPKPASFPNLRWYVARVFLWSMFPLFKVFEVFKLWPNILGHRIGVIRPDFGDYKPLNTDIIVCSYFKSGTTWLLQTTIQILFRGKAEFRNIHHVVPWPDTPIPSIARRTISLFDPSPLARSPTNLRLIKTHMLRSGIPFVNCARYIVITRDPKDVCVSSYHFLKAGIFGPLMPSIDRWVEYMFSKDFEISWAEHLASYWSVRHEPNVIFFTYEELNKNHCQAIKKIAKFVDIQLSLEDINSIEFLSSFEYMKSVGNKFDPVVGRIFPWSSDHFMIRRGATGSSGELLTVSQQKFIDDYCRSELKRLGCDFPYDDFFSAT